MILKASQRGGGQNLAAHLLRGDENEHVEVHEVRGFVSEDLHAAFKEAQAIARGTRCRQYLFSLSLNPPAGETVSVDAFKKAISKIESDLGLKGQPRALVFHEKEGRRHAHCIWSRIDADEMKAKQLSHFKNKLCAVSKELYLEHGWKMPRGLMNSEERNPKNFTLAEWQQAKRTGLDPKEIKATIQDCWAVSDSKASFKNALHERGFYLAKGDRRGFVLLDYHGEVYAVSRAVGIKTKDIKKRLGDEDALSSVSETKSYIADAMTPKVKQLIQDARLGFKHKTATVAHNKARIVHAQQEQRRKLHSDQMKRTSDDARQRAAKLPRGLKAVWFKVTGRYKKSLQVNKADFERCQLRDSSEREALIANQIKERRLFQSEIETMRKRQSVTLRELRQDIRRYHQLEVHAPNEDQRQIKRRRRQRTMQP